MLTNKIFNASALLLPIKSIYAFYQIYICLLSNMILYEGEIGSLLPTLLHYFVSTFFH